MAPSAQLFLEKLKTVLFPSSGKNWGSANTLQWHSRGYTTYNGNTQDQCLGSGGFEGFLAALCDPFPAVLVAISVIPLVPIAIGPAW